MTKMSKPECIKALSKALMRQRVQEFPKTGKPMAENKPGVYVIHGSNGAVLHVGKSCDVKQGLYNHLSSQSSFAKKFLDRDGKRLRNGRYTFRYMLVKHDRTRALLEAFVIGSLCPKHIGQGYVRSK